MLDNRANGLLAVPAPKAATAGGEGAGGGEARAAERARAAEKSSSQEVGSRPVPLRAYGVLTAKIERRTRATTRSDHYMLRCSGGWEVSINAHSDVPPSEVEFAVVPIKPRNYPQGWRALRLGDGLDYVRGGICKPEQFKALPISKPGADNDLNELFDRHLTVGATIQAFGEPYGGGQRGVHDVHQNQGNVAMYRRDDGVWQDGGLIVGSTAILLRFQSQSWKTDNSTGHAR